MLRLNDNRLTDVPDRAFDGISTKLREIHLERNLITELGMHPFRNLPSLKVLNLAENLLGILEGGSLFFNQPLDLLDLSRNRIVSVARDAFVDPAFPSKQKHNCMSSANSVLFENSQDKNI